MDDPWDLQRFVLAQGDEAGFGRVLQELHSGRKAGHWMWYVFPQIAGLGHSAMSKRYAVSSLEEASAYLRHPVLGARLRQCAEIVAASQASSAEQIFGPIDAQKLRSSMTLFFKAAADLAAADDAVFQQVLDRYYDGKPDSTTVNLLAAAL